MKIDRASAREPLPRGAREWSRRPISQAGLGQDFHSRSMKVKKLLHRFPIVSSKLGAVSEIGSEGSNGGGNQCLMGDFLKTCRASATDRLRTPTA